MANPVVNYPNIPNFEIKQNDILPALRVSCLDFNGRPIQLYNIGASVNFRMVLENETTSIVNAPALILPDPFVTPNFTTGQFTSNLHGLTNQTPVYLTSSGNLPTGTDTTVPYYVTQAQVNSFYLSTAPNGAPITYSDNGSGTISVITGRLQYQWVTADTATAGQYWGEFNIVFNDNSTITCPSHQYIFITIYKKA